MSKSTEQVAGTDDTGMEMEETMNEATLRTAFTVPEPSLRYQQRLDMLVDAANRRGQQDAEQTAETGWGGHHIARRGVVWMAGTAVATAVAGVGIFLTLAPRQAAARDALILRVTHAVATAKTAHLREWYPSKGKGEPVRESWFSAAVGTHGAWRTKGNGYEILRRDHLVYFYFWTAKRVEVSEAWEDKPLLSVSGRLRRLQEAGLSDRVSLLPDATVEGRPAKCLLLELPPCPPRSEPAFQERSVPLRAIVAVDPQTDLPFRTETQAQIGFGWQTMMVEEVSYDQPTDLAQFATDFPGANVITREKATADKLQRFRDGLTRNATPIVVGDRAVTLRGVDGTELGDAFVLYSIPSGTPLPTVELGDRTARHWRYLGGGMVGRTQTSLVSTWTQANGERLCIAWFRNEKPMTDEEGGDWKVRFRFAGPGGGVSSEYTPRGGRMCSGAIPWEGPYREIIAEHPALLTTACRNRAAAFRDGRWRADAGLLRLALQGELSTGQQSEYWEAEARRIAAEAKQ